MQRIWIDCAVYETCAWIVVPPFDPFPFDLLREDQCYLAGGDLERLWSCDERHVPLVLCIRARRLHHELPFNRPLWEAHGCTMYGTEDDARSAA